MHSSQYLRKEDRVATGALQRAHSMRRRGSGEVRLYLPITDPSDGRPPFQCREETRTAALEGLRPQRTDQEHLRYEQR